MLALGPVAALADSVPAQRGPVDRSFKRWFRDFKAGRIEPGEVVKKRKHYIDKSLQHKIPMKRRYTRLDEADFLFGLLKERADARTAKKLFEVVAVSLKKKGGKLWQPAGKLSIIRQCLLDKLVENGCPPEFQEATVARIELGLKEVAGAPKGEGNGDEEVAGTFTHSEPEIAAALIPLLGVFNQPKHRVLLEKLLRVKEPGIVTMAAHAFAVMGYGPAVAPVARVLHGQKFRDEIGWLSQSLQRLIPCESPKPEEKDLKYAINLVLDLFETCDDWRSRLALVPVTRMIRSRASVPVLISLLEKAKQSGEKAVKMKKGVYSGTLLAAVNQALVDLTGFFADSRKPEDWRAWWDSNKATFKLVEAKKQIVIEAGDSFVRGFFGIPVTGNRVLFIVDVSGSMIWPMRTKDYVPGQVGRGAKGSYESRWDRAKKELAKAIGSMGADSKFNVVFFAGHVDVWEKKLIPATKKGKASFMKKLSRTNAGGGTAVYDAMEAGLGLSAAPNRKAKHPFADEVDEVFVLSDGAPSMGKILQPTRILKVVEAWNRRAQVRVHAVYLGDEKIDAEFTPPGAQKPPEEWLKPEVFMRRLAEQNQGSFQEPAKG